MNLGTRWGGSLTPHPGRFNPWNEQLPLYRRLGGPQDRPERVRKISPLTRIRCPDQPSCSKSLYRLRYPGPSVARLSVLTVATDRNCQVFRLNHACDEVKHEFIIDLHPMAIIVDGVIFKSSTCSLALPTLHIYPTSTPETNPVRNCHLVGVGI